MTLDDYFRDQISRGQPPLVALNNAAQAYADSLRKRPDCSQYADETAAWGEQRDRAAVELLREAMLVVQDLSSWGDKIPWLGRVRKFLEGKQ